MRRILVITNNFQQASYRLRIETLIEPLRQRGLTLVPKLRPKAILARRSFLKNAGRYDAVLLQRKLLDPADARVLRTYARRIFYDVDDAVMEHQKPVGIVSRWRTQRRFEATAGIIHHVVAGNAYLAERFAARGCATTILPTVVDTDHYTVRQHAPTDAPRLVWIGSRSTLPYLSAALPAIERAAEVVPGLRLLIIADQTLTSSRIPIEFHRWSAQSEAQALVSADIGIAPTPHDAWTVGKCGFKIVQYMAAGLPVIASPVGVNAQIVAPEQTGLLADSNAQWIAAIRRLASDPQLRESMGQAARARVEQEYSLTRAVNVWAHLLSEC